MQSQNTATNAQMNIQVTFEPTPNPATLKFNFGKTLLDRSLNCTSAQESDKSPLAQKLFGYPWTSSVFIGPDFVSVTKQDWVDWEVLAEPLSAIIQEHIERGEPLWVDLPEVETDINENDPEIVKQIKSILASEIRPVVALDGGDIAFVKYENNNLYVHMKGACSGCPSSQATLKEGIEVRMRQAFPEIREVLAI